MDCHVSFLEHYVIVVRHHAIALDRDVSPLSSQAPPVEELQPDGVVDARIHFEMIAILVAQLDFEMMAVSC